MDVYFVTRDTRYIKEILAHLNFSIVLVSKGCFPARSCVWMGWQRPGDTANRGLFDQIDAEFGLSRMGIGITQSTIFPEGLIWEDQYDELIVFGEPEELQTYIRRICVFSPEPFDRTDFPETFIYKLECEVFENGKAGHRALRTTDLGFVYRGEERRER